MKVDIFPTAALVDPDRLAGKTVLVIDVLRATSTIVSALAAGASRVIPVATIEEAREAALSLPPGTYLLGGERKALKIPGFDLDNSPRQYTREAVAGKIIILTTTNGTQAICRSKEARNLFLASFLNARAAARWAREAGTDVFLACAGTLGHFSLDDAACAGLLAHYLQELEPKVQLSDFAVALRHLYLSHRDKLPQLIAQASHYQRLVGLGLKADIDHCLQQDTFTVVPRWEEGTGLVTAE